MVRAHLLKRQDVSRPRESRGDTSMGKTKTQTGAVLPSVYEARSNIWTTNIRRCHTSSEETHSKEHYLLMDTAMRRQLERTEGSTHASDRVLDSYDTTKSTRIYEEPAELTLTIAQLQLIEGSDKQGWRPVTHTSHAKTQAEMNFGKVNGVVSSPHRNP